MAGKPGAVFPEPEIISKKGKIPSRGVNETHLKVTRPKSSKVTEKPKAERRQKGRPDEQDTASTCSSEKADCMNGAKIVSEPTSALNWRLTEFFFTRHISSNNAGWFRSAYEYFTCRESSNKPVKTPVFFMRESPKLMHYVKSQEY